MGLAVVDGATLSCSMGMFESVLIGASGRFQVEA
jgi:hypothetical protein